jgi:hypothetical protein
MFLNSINQLILGMETPCVTFAVGTELQDDLRASYG